MRELLLTIDARELMEWEVMQQFDPIGGRRAELSAAAVQAAVYGAFGGARVSPDDLAPDWGGLRKDEARKAVEEVDAVEWGKNLTRALGGTVDG